MICIKSTRDHTTHTFAVVEVDAPAWAGFGQWHGCLLGGQVQEGELHKEPHHSAVTRQPPFRSQAERLDLYPNPLPALSTVRCRAFTHYSCNKKQFNSIWEQRCWPFSRSQFPRLRSRHCLPDWRHSCHLCPLAPPPGCLGWLFQNIIDRRDTGKKKKTA